MADKDTKMEVNGEDFTKDVTTNDVASSENGDTNPATGAANGSSENAGAAGNQRDDDRYFK